MAGQMKDLAGDLSAVGRNFIYNRNEMPAGELVVYEEPVRRNRT
jgi:hypothetical protein